MMTMTMMMDEQVRGVGLLREGGVRVSRPHLDALHTQVDEMGSDMWVGEVPVGPDGEPLVCTVPKTDGELRDLRAESILGGPASDGEPSKCSTHGSREGGMGEGEGAGAGASTVRFAGGSSLTSLGVAVTGAGRGRGATRLWLRWYDAHQRGGCRVGRGSVEIRVVHRREWAGGSGPRRR